MFVSQAKYMYDVYIVENSLEEGFARGRRISRDGFHVSHSHKERKRARTHKKEEKKRITLIHSGNG